MEICNTLGQIIFLLLEKVNKIIYAYTFLDTLHVGKTSVRNQDTRGQQYLSRLLAGPQQILPVFIFFPLQLIWKILTLFFTIPYKSN